MNRYFVLVLPCLAICVCIVRADEVKKKDGTVLNGRIIEETETQVVLEQPDGARRLVARVAIESIQRSLLGPASTRPIARSTQPSQPRTDNARIPSHPPPGMPAGHGEIGVARPPQEAVDLSDRSKKHWEAGECEEAIKLLTRAIELAPEYGDAHNNLSHCYQSKRQFDRAIASASIAIQIDPRNGTYWCTLGMAYYYEGKMDECIKALKMAINLGNRSGAIYSVLGNAHFKSNQLDEAIAAYNTALQIDPGLRGARNNLRLAEEQKKAAP